MKAHDLKQKEVINIVDAERLGYICDVDIDFENGRLRSVIIPRRSGFRLFGKREEYVIPWEKIVSVGRELVLVRVEPPV